MIDRRTAAALQVARILHGAMMFSVILYGVVLWQVGLQQHGKVVPSPITMQYGAFVAAAIAGVVIIVLGTTQMARARQGDPHRLIPRLQTPMIMRLAGAEAIALGGFMGTFLSQMTNFIPYGVGAVVALACMAAFFPRANMFSATSSEPGAP